MVGRDETRSRADPGAIGRKHTALNGSARHHRRGKPSSRIIRASEILVPVADEPEKGMLLFPFCELFSLVIAWNRCVGDSSRRRKFPGSSTSFPAIPR